MSETKEQPSGVAPDVESAMEEGKLREPPKRRKRAAKEPSAAEYNAMDKSVKDTLQNQEKVRVRLFQVPKDSSDEPLPDQEVAVNGYVYVLKRGVSLEVPQTVADILEQAGHI